MFLYFYILLGLVTSLIAGPIIEITQGQIQPEPISLLPTFADDDWSLGKKIDKVIEADLETSGMFSLMPQDTFPQTNKTLSTEPVLYADWRVTKTRFVYFSTLKVKGDKIAIKFELHDAIRGKKMLELNLSGDRQKWRRVAHMISDAVYQTITGEDGFFNTQIAFVEPASEKGRNFTTRLKVMDSDGYPESVVSLTDGKKLVLTPRYSPDGKTIVYLILDKNKGEVYIVDRMSKVSRLMGRYVGLNFAPRYSPDSKKIVFSIAKQGSTAIYEQNLYTQELTRLTEHTGIDTSPGYSPDGKKIVFVSDRAGRPQLYVMNADGSGNAELISSKKGTYTQPCWSPRGDLIAYTFQKAGKFYIGIMKPDGEGERLIATSYLVEDPVWTSNGRYLLFTMQQNSRDKQHIVRIDLTGRHQYHIETKGEAFGPSLSPLLGRAIMGING